MSQFDELVKAMQVLSRSGEHLQGQHDQKTHGRGDGEGQKRKVTALYESGVTRKEVNLEVSENPTLYHGTYQDSVGEIEKSGFIPSETGTAGAGVYLTENEADALYERDPNRSRAVKTHSGEQPDTVVKTRIKGDVLDVGKMGDKYGPSLYLKPDVYAAMVLSSKSGNQVDVGDLIRNPSKAKEIIRQHGYSGVSWAFSDGRKAAIIFDPKDIEVIK